MKRYKFFLAPILACLTAFSVTAMALAQDAEPPQLKPSVSIEFGENVEFSLSVEYAEAPIRAALFLRPSLESQFKANIAEKTSSTSAQFKVQLNPQSIKLHPFTQLEYYWQVDFANGEVTTTEPVRVTYVDTRFDWHVLNRDQIQVYWVDGGVDWAQDVYAIAASALPEITLTLGARMDRSRQIYIYPTQSDLQNSMRLAGITQASAHTLPELGVVLVAGKDDPETLIRFEQEIPHELVHVLLYERMGADIDNLPVWLDEGLATNFERSPRQVYDSALSTAAEQNALLDMQSLCASFPISGTDRILAYAQSASFTNYLLDVYGTGGIVQLLDAYEEGTTCTGGVQRVYQRSLGRLEDEWKRVAFENSFGGQSIRSIYIIIAGLAILVLLIAALLFRRTRTQTKAG